MRLPHVLKALVFLSLGLSLGTGIFLEGRNAVRVQPQKHLQKEILEIREADRLSDWQDELQRRNPDWRAWLQFESGLISLPVVQGDDNSWYLDHLFDGSYGIVGTLFFDHQCQPSDPVRVIYGHSVFFDTGLMFTPLHRLADQRVFEENRFFSLYEEHEEKLYEIFAVCLLDENREPASLVRTRRFVSADEQKRWLEQVMGHSSVSCDYVPSGTESILVLQTCAEAEGSLRLCVFASLLP